LIRIS